MYFIGLRCKQTGSWTVEGTGTVSRLRHHPFLGSCFWHDIVRHLSLASVTL